MIFKLRNILLSLLIILLITSCGQREKDYVTKFIYFKYFSISYDSTKKPQLRIIQYFEYKPNTPIKLAKGGFFDGRNPSPKYSLFNFYNYSSNNSFNEMLNKTFCQIPYGRTSIQKIHKSDKSNLFYCGDLIPSVSFFILETSENKKIKIEIDLKSITSEFKILLNNINNIFNLKTLTKVNRFDIDNSIETLQKQIFNSALFPPPPPPEALEQKVKFTAPIQKKKDIIIEAKDSLSRNIDINSDSIK